MEVFEVDRTEVSIGVRLMRETLIDLERYIVSEGLHRYRIKPSQVATMIVKDWLNKPILDKSKLIYGRINNEPKISRLTVKLLEEENIKLYEIYVKEYIRECLYMHNWINLMYSRNEHNIGVTTVAHQVSNPSSIHKD